MKIDQLALNEAIMSRDEELWDVADNSGVKLSILRVALNTGEASYQTVVKLCDYLGLPMWKLLKQRRR